MDTASADLHAHFASAAAAVHTHFVAAAAAAAAAVLLLLKQHAQSAAAQMRLLSCQLLAQLPMAVAASQHEYASAAACFAG